MAIGTITWNWPDDVLLQDTNAVDIEAWHFCLISGEEDSVLRRRIHTNDSSHYRTGKGLNCLTNLTIRFHTQDHLAAFCNSFSVSRRILGICENQTTQENSG